MFPDFQLRVHMHCPGQVLIHREMKRKRINSFYMNAQQAGLVRVRVQDEGRKGKRHNGTANAHTPRHILYVYTHMTTSLDTRV